MKILRITESQYKRLVRKKNLNEQFKKIVYNDPKDEYDAHPYILHVLEHALWISNMLFSKSLYVDRIEKGVVYLDSSKYTQEEIKELKTEIEKYVKASKYPKDKILSSDFGFDSGKDADYDWSQEDEVVVDDPDEEEDEVVVDDPDEEEDEDTVTVDFGLKSLTTPQKIILQVISDAEAVNHSYDSHNPGKIIDGLSNLSMEEVKRRHPKGAKGRYQFMPDYFDQFTKNVGLKMSDKFSPENQDKMALDLFKSKMGDCLELEDKLVRTWAGLPVLYPRQGDKRYVERGESYYEERAGNTAIITPSRFEKALKSCGCNMTKLRSKINKYISPECILTQDEEKLYNDNIKNDSDAKDFRWWVHQDSQRIKKVNDGLNECGYGDGLDLGFGKNEYTEIAFKLVGKKWVDEGKPKKPNVGDIKRGLPKANFDKIPNSTNYRSGQLTLSELKYVIENYGIKNIVRMNGDSEKGGESDGKAKSNDEEVLRSEEKELAESLGVNYQTIFAHQGYVDGEGYVTSTEKIQPILNKGNTLIHCRNGSDRTGGQVGKYLLDNGYGDEQKIWDYTIKYNGWCGMSNFINSGYRKYAETFVPNITKEEYEELCGDYKKKEKYDGDIPQTDKMRILVIGDSQSWTDGKKYKKYHSYLNKNKYYVTEAAEGGKQTTWMYNELKKHDIKDYDVVIIMGGGNDALKKKTTSSKSYNSKIERTKRNFDSMYDYVNSESPNTTLIAITNPTKRYKDFSKSENEAPKNDEVSHYVRDNEKPDYIIDSNILDETNLSGDKIHLNSNGHQWIYRQLKSILDKL